MSLIYESSVFTSTYDVLKNFHTIRKTFDKGERYTLGESIEQAVLDVLLSIIDAGLSKHEWKITAIDQASRQLERAKILIRLSHDMGQVRERSYMELEEQLNKIGRMLGGWRRAS